MRRQRLGTGFVVGVGVLVLVAMIALVTYVALRIISQTVQEQFESTELQLATALSQQTQASLNNLGAGINDLAIREEIRATSPTRQESAIALLAQKANNYPEGTIVSITRFDLAGNPRYAWPPELNAEIRGLESRQNYVYSVPDRLLELTSRGQRATAQIPLELHRVPHRDRRGVTILLIAPVDSVSLNTEFIAFELNLPAFFADQFSFVDLGERGQFWVIDGRQDIQYQARALPSIAPVLQEFTFGQLRGTVRPRIDSYEDSGETRQLTIARSQVLNQSETFVLLLSREEGAAQQAVQENVIFIFVFSVAAMLGIIAIGSVFTRQIGRVNNLRRQEVQRRQTARTLLEVSRALNSSLDLSVVLEQILGQLERLVPHDSASVLLLEGSQELRVAATRGLNTETTGEILTFEQARAARVVISSGYPIVINDTSQDDRWSPDPESHIAAWMGLPLRVREQLVGVLNINSTEVDRFRQEDVEVTEAFADQASVALQNARSHEIEVKQIEQELTIARGIQASLLPDAPPQVPQIEVVTRSLPASQVSGDYFQYLPMPDGRIGIAIGDVQGKGIPAALLMAVITTALRDEIARNPAPADLLQSLNTRLLTRMQRTHMNSALIVAVFDPSSRRLEIANGGMVQPYIRHQDSTEFDFVAVGGYPLGVSDNMKYTAKELNFEAGSIMVMFSDGVLEAQNADGEFFGFDRVEALLNNLPPDVTAQMILEQLYAAVQDHLDGLAPQDDTTIMVLRALDHPVDVLLAPDAKPQNGHEEESISIIEPEAVLAVPLSVDVTTVVGQNAEMVVEEMRVPAVVSTVGGPYPRKNVELYLPSKLGFEKIARSTVEALAIEMEFEEEKIENLKTAIAEACMNAIEHGNGEDPNLLVSVIMSATPNEIELRITDRGLKQLSAELPEPGLGDMRGWGLFFIQNLMDVFEIKQLPDGGNQVLMVSYARQNLDSEHADRP